jgi:hypothetical protein
LGISQASSQETIDERYKELTQQFRKLTAERKDKKAGDFNIQTEAYEYLTSSVKDRTGKTQRMHYDALFPPNYKQTVRGRPKKSLTASPVYEDKITERFEEEKANKQLKRLPFLKSEPLDEEQPKKQRKKLPSVKLEPGAAIPKDSNVIDLVSYPDDMIPQLLSKQDSNLLHVMQVTIYLYGITHNGRYLADPPARETNNKSSITRYKMKIQKPMGVDSSHPCLYAHLRSFVEDAFAFDQMQFDPDRYILAKMTEMTMFGPDNKTLYFVCELIDENTFKNTLGGEFKLVVFDKVHMQSITAASVRKESSSAHLKLTPEQTLPAAINSLVSESQVQLRSKANGHYEIPWLNNYIFKEEYHKKKVEALRSLIANALKFHELGTWVHNNEPEVAEVCSRIREILGKETNQGLLPPHVEYSQIHVSKDSTIHSGNHRSRSVFNQYQNSPSFCDQTHIKDRATIASAQLSDKRVIVK